MFIQEIALEECQKAFLDAGCGRLACALDNQPYVVPIHFCVDGHYAYAFSMPGKKIEWMRKNPLVCLEIDDVTGRDDWISIVATGRYEELPNTPEFQSDRTRALELMQERCMWWQPGSVPLNDDVNGPKVSLVVFRIALERLTGRRGRPAAAPITSAPVDSWLGRLLHTTGARP